MAKFTIEFLETKSPDWKIASLTPKEGGQTLMEVSINKTSKKGEAFPNFDTMMTGHDVEGELWVSSAGKQYLFPPKPQTPQGGANRGFGGVAKAQETKGAMIEKAQENRATGVKISATMRDAVLIVTTIMNNNPAAPISNGEIKGMILEWRKWLWSEFDKQDSDFPPFN